MYDHTVRNDKPPQI